MKGDGRKDDALLRPGAGRRAVAAVADARAAREAVGDAICQPGAEVGDESSLVNHQVNEEHQPRRDEDDCGEHRVGPAGQQEQWDDRRNDQRQRHPLVEARERLSVRG